MADAIASVIVVKTCHERLFLVHPDQPVELFEPHQLRCDPARRAVGMQALVDRGERVRRGIETGHRIHDQREPIRAEIDGEEIYMVEYTKLLSWFAERCERKLRDEPQKGKAGRNVKAVRFARIMCKNHGYRYESPLYGVVAAATNAIYDTSYSSPDIRKLVSR